MTAGHNALRGSDPGQKPAFLDAPGTNGLSRSPDRPALHYVLFALPTFTSRRMTGAISSRRKGDRFFVMLIPSHHGVKVTTLPSAVPETKILGGQLGLSLRSSYNSLRRMAVVTGLIAEDKTVAGWGLGDTIPRAQLGWTAGGWSNTLYVTGWLPTGRYQRGFEPNTGKNRYGLNLGWGVTYIEPKTLIEFDSAIGVTWSSYPATDYQNGDAFTWEWAVGKTLANGLKIGVAGYAYQ